MQIIPTRRPRSRFTIIIATAGLSIAAMWLHALESDFRAQVGISEHTVVQQIQNARIDELDQLTDQFVLAGTGIVLQTRIAAARALSQRLHASLPQNQRAYSRLIQISNALSRLSVNANNDLQEAIVASLDEIAAQTSAQAIGEDRDAMVEVSQSAVVARLNVSRSDLSRLGQRFGSSANLIVLPLFRSVRHDWFPDLLALCDGCYQEQIEQVLRSIIQALGSEHERSRAAASALRARETPQNEDRPGCDDRSECGASYDEEPSENRWYCCDSHTYRLSDPIACFEMYENDGCAGARFREQPRCDEACRETVGWCIGNPVYKTLNNALFLRAECRNSSYWYVKQSAARSYESAVQLVETQLGRHR
jgi:hypothetical protein